MFYSSPLVHRPSPLNPLMPRPLLYRLSFPKTILTILTTILWALNRNESHHLAYHRSPLSPSPHQRASHENSNNKHSSHGRSNNKRLCRPGLHTVPQSRPELRGRPLPWLYPDIFELCGGPLHLQFEKLPEGHFNVGTHPPPPEHPFRVKCTKLQQKLV